MTGAARRSRVIHIARAGRYGLSPPKTPRAGREAARAMTTTIAAAPASHPTKRREPAFRALHLFGLCGCVAQPSSTSSAKAPPFRRAGRARVQIVLFALALVLVPPACCSSSSRASPSSRRRSGAGRWRRLSASWSRSGSPLRSTAGSGCGRLCSRSCSSRSPLVRRSCTSGARRRRASLRTSAGAGVLLGALPVRVAGERARRAAPIRRPWRGSAAATRRSCSSCSTSSRRERCSTRTARSRRQTLSRVRAPRIRLDLVSRRDDGGPVDEPGRARALERDSSPCGPTGCERIPAVVVHDARRSRRSARGRVGTWLCQQPLRFGKRAQEQCERLGQGHDDRRAPSDPAP